MVVIDSTPEFVANAYTIMRRNLEIVRPRLGRPMGLADKLVLSHLDDPENQELEAGRSYLLARPDRVILQDVLGQTAMLVFMQTRRSTTAVHHHHEDQSHNRHQYRDTPFSFQTVHGSP